jgi:hypothetical protein
MNAGGPSLPGVQFRAQRSSVISSDWKITQIAGPDFGRDIFKRSAPRL